MNVDVDRFFTTVYVLIYCWLRLLRFMIGFTGVASFSRRIHLDKGFMTVWMRFLPVFTGLCCVLDALSARYVYVPYSMSIVCAGSLAFEFDVNS